MFTDFSASQNECSGGNYCSFAHFSVVEHRRTHAYQGTSAHCACMYCGIVAY